MPPENGLGLDDQEHLAEPATVEDLREHAKHDAVGVVKRCVGHLSLQYQQMVAKGEDLGVTAVATGQQEPNSSDHEAENEGQRPEHELRTYPPGHRIADQRRRVFSTHSNMD